MDIEAEITKLQVAVNKLESVVNAYFSNPEAVYKLADHNHNYKMSANAKEQAQITVKTEGTYEI